MSALLHGSLERGRVNVIILPYLAGDVNGYSYVYSIHIYIYIYIYILNIILYVYTYILQLIKIILIENNKLGT